MKIAAALALVLAACIIPAQQPAGGGGYNGGGGGGTYSGGAGAPGGAAQPGGEGDPNNAPAGPVDVEIHSSCPETVPVFYGEDPGYSGTESSVESNSISNQTFQPGDKMWIVDGEEHGIASVTVGPNTRTIEISQDCNSLIAN